MPIGYEWGYTRAVHVVDTTPADREAETGIDISSYISAINALRSELRAANVEGAQARISAPDADFVALVRYDSGHPASAQNAVIVIFNPTDEPVPVDAGALITRTGGMLGPFVDRTPDAEPIAFHPGQRHRSRTRRVADHQHATQRRSPSFRAAGRRTGPAASSSRR